MNNSIESIWKQGVIENDALVAPKINDLYQLKSQNVVDRFERMFDLNLKAIIAGTIIAVGIMLNMALPILAIAFFVMNIGLVVKGQAMQRQLSKLTKGTSSYDYLLSFRSWFDDAITEYTRIYRLFYPVLFLALISQLLVLDIVQQGFAGYLHEFPATWSFFGVPVFIIVAILVVSWLISLAAPAIYKADINIVYGRQIERLNEIIGDIESLQE